MEGLNKRIVLTNDYRGENTHAKPIVGKLNSVEFPDVDAEMRHCIALLRIWHRAVVRPDSYWPYNGAGARPERTI
jgi:hypothetical protein